MQSAWDSFQTLKIQIKSKGMKKSYWDNANHKKSGHDYGNVIENRLQD